MSHASRQIRRRVVLPCVAVVGLLLSCPVRAATAADAPAGHGVAGREVSFGKDIKPLLEASCIQCHAKGKAKGGLSLETREAMLAGGDSGPAATPGKGKDSLIVKLVSSSDPDEVMPKKGTKWTPDQVALLRAWIDNGMRWDDGVTFAKAPPANLKPRQVALPVGDEPHPVDRLVAAYLKDVAAKSANGAPPPALTVVDDRLFARRAWLDAIGLLPPPAELEAFVADRDPDKRAKLVAKLLADPYGYADHWLTFWNDLLRNDYKGTGFIDGGRSQVTGWLYSALLTNKPYDRFVRELTSPAADSEGFVRGIVWRGTVPASMSIPMQAAQNVSQVFLGVNLKCAGCHDSFVSDWTLADAYGLAAVFNDNDKPLELVHCDRPTGKTAAAQFLYPEVGGIDPKLGRDERLERFSELLTSSANGRLSRNVVNRLWSRLMGRGLVEPLDDMEKPAWSPDLLDWLAEDLAANRYDLKRTIALVMTSRAYQMPVVEPAPEAPAAGSGGGGGSGNVSASASTTASAYVFRGPHARRLSAEQFADAVSTLTGDWGDFPASVELDYTARGALNAPPRLPAWVWTTEPVTTGVRRTAWQTARAKGDAAQKAAADAQKAIDADAPNAAELSAKAKAAADESAKAAALADAVIRSPERAAQIASGAGSLDAPAVPLVRHKVVFRKRFALTDVPERALAAVVASQRVEVFVNGKPLVTVSNDREKALLGDRRSAFADLKPLLQKGENVVVLAVDSHTERPDLKNEDRPRLPGVFNHLNEQSGVAFVATLASADGNTSVEWATDATWTVRRSPEAGWQRPDFADKDWPAAAALPPGTAPEDVGPILTDAGVRPAGKPGTDLAVRLPGLVALTARTPGTVRASLQAADPLQLALGRPNREMVTSVRQDAATTIQAMELTNGGTLDAALKKSAGKLAAAAAKDPPGWVEAAYRQLLSRPPSDDERKFAVEALGEEPTPEAVADLVWALAMQPEFQYVH